MGLFFKKMRAPHYARLRRKQKCGVCLKPVRTDATARSGGNIQNSAKNHIGADLELQKFFSRFGEPPPGRP